MGRSSPPASWRTVTPARAAAAATASLTNSGTSRCSSTTRAPRTTPSAHASSHAAASQPRKLAPGATTESTAPPSSTTTKPWPLPPSHRSTPATSTPASSRAANKASPAASAPTLPTKATSARPSASRAHATAWLQPLPPPHTSGSALATTVSPLRGMASTSTVVSRLALPTTTSRGLRSRADAALKRQKARIERRMFVCWRGLIDIVARASIAARDPLRCNLCRGRGAAFAARVVLG
mmetsp:Transcript_22146/g.66469  ORF Transcript_22146/g.66469 Transcript_22146/m.66469 type:complete len:238 (+) Transcript_22146:139-852(+)